MSSINESLGHLDVESLRSVLLHLVKEIPDAKSVALTTLAARVQTSTSPKRSMSVNDLDRAGSSTPGNRGQSLHGKINGHVFVQTTYSHLTLCAKCQQPLAGVVNQGHQCSRCLYNAHEGCMPLLDECQGRKMSKSIRAKRKLSLKHAVDSSSADAGGSPLKTVAAQGDVPNSTEDSDDDSENSFYEENSTSGSSSEESESDDEGGQTDSFSSLPRFAGLAPAEPDWKSHSKSFRDRLKGSRPHDEQSLTKAVKNPLMLNKEFDNIPQNKVNMHDMPRLTEDKNRYMNVLPNTHTRVILDELPDDPTSSYINANWIAGYGDEEKCYIAAQGPLEGTAGDFWRMVWQCDVGVIVMNTNLVEAGTDKCFPYWPANKKDGAVKYGDLTIKHVEKSQPQPQYTMTKLKVTHKDGKQKDVYHMWWTDWPDKGVPDNCVGIGPFVLHTRELKKKLGGPVLVHCSAGVGRTGCFMSIDIGMHQYDEEGQIDVLHTVGQLRQARGVTVQTESQYRFIHQVLLQHMQGTLCNGSTAAGLASSPQKLKASAKEASHEGGEGTAACGNDELEEMGEGDLPHNFKSKTFVIETRCTVCDKPLTGLKLQGLRCRGCESNVHPECLKEIQGGCRRLPSYRFRRKASGLPVWPPQRDGRPSGRRTKRRISRE